LLSLTHSLHPPHLYLVSSNAVDEAAVTAAGAIPPLVELLINGPYEPQIRSSTSSGIVPGTATAALLASLPVGSDLHIFPAYLASDNAAEKAAVVATGAIPPLVELLINGPYEPQTRGSTSSGIVPAATTATLLALLLVRGNFRMVS
jgi:hypothetical protein